MNDIFADDKRLPEILGNLHIVNDLDGIRSIAEAFQSAYVHSQEIQSQISASIIHETIEKLQEAFQYAPQLESIQRQMDAFVKEAQKFEEFKERMLSQGKDEEAAFQSAGWWISPKLLDQDVRIINRAVKTCLAGEVNALDGMFLSVFEKDDQKVLNEMVESWKENSFFKEWAPIIADAQKAHIEGRYSLSIPSLLLVIEGISRSMARALNIYEHKEMRSHADIIISTIIKAANERTPELDLSADYFLNALKNFLYQNVNKGGIIEEPPAILNRHSVMHGYSTIYGTVTNSLRCFMVLDVLNIFNREEVTKISSS